MTLQQDSKTVRSITLYDKQGNIDGELSLDEIRESVEKRRNAVNILFKYVEEKHIQAAYQALNEAASWQVRMELLLNRRRFSEEEKETILQILLAAAGDEIERSRQFDGIEYDEKPTETGNRSTTELIDLIIRGQSQHE